MKVAGTGWKPLPASKSLKGVIFPETECARAPQPRPLSPDSTLNTPEGDKVFAFRVAKQSCVLRGWLRGFSCWLKGEIVRLCCGTCERGFTDPAYIFPTYTDTVATFRNQNQFLETFLTEPTQLPRADASPGAPAHTRADDPKLLPLKTLLGPGTSYLSPTAGYGTQPPLPWQGEPGRFAPRFPPAPVTAPGGFFTLWCLPMFRRGAPARPVCQNPVAIEGRRRNPTTGQSGTRRDQALALKRGTQKLRLPS